MNRTYHNQGSAVSREKRSSGKTHSRERCNGGGVSTRDEEMEQLNKEMLKIQKRKKSECVNYPS